MIPLANHTPDPVYIEESPGNSCPVAQKYLMALVALLKIRARHIRGETTEEDLRKAEATAELAFAALERRYKEPAE